MVWNPLDRDAQPKAGFNAHRRVERDLAEMLGIAKGVLFDGVVSEQEAVRLNEWVGSHGELASEWPGSVLAKRLRSIFSDGRVTPEERDDLRLLLQELVGGETGMISGDTVTSNLPLDDPRPDLEVTNCTFVLTGRFAFGPRRACEEATRAVGGWAEANVTKRTDFLVLGTFASRDWINTAYGRKIEKAVEYRERFGHPHIIGEDHWASEL